MTWTWIGPALDVRPLFPAERRDLLELLAGLEAADWERPTACPGWTVHDIVAHIAHDHIRRLSGTRDRYESGGFAPGEDLATFINRVNEEFVETARRWSPAVLVDLVDHLGGQLDQTWAGLDLDGTARIDVAWAEPGVPAPIWLDMARELSEFWIHQQQVRDAVGVPGARADELVGAVVDTLVRGLPLTLSGPHAEPGTRVGIRIEEVGVGGTARAWVATRDDLRWHLEPVPALPPCDATVRLSADTLWRLASGGIGPGEAAARAVVSGDRGLAGAALHLVAVIR